jgi:hypothetical protein
MIVETDVNPATLDATWAVCDGTLGTPDLRGRFVIGVSGTFLLNATGGATTVDSSHGHGAGTYAGPSHGHGHSHTSAAHSHSHGHSHTHTSAAHSHSHNHTSAAHSHSHNHSGSTLTAGTGTEVTGGAIGGTTSVRNDIAAVTVNTAPHTHGQSTMPVSGNTGTDATSTTPGNTGSDGTLGGTGSVTGTSGTSGSTTLAIVPPYYALHHVKRIA